MRTAFGVAVLTFYVVLFVAGSQDVIATTFDVSVFTVLWTLRILLIVAPRHRRDRLSARTRHPAAAALEQEIDDEIDEVGAERDGAGQDGTEPQVNR